MSLVARHLEAVGIPSLVIGSGRDIVEECGVPRFLFVDFPLGNPCGKPWDVPGQSSILAEGLSLMERAWQPRTTVQSRALWSEVDNSSWRANFMRVDDSNRDALAQAGAERRAMQAARKVQAEDSHNRRKSPVEAR